MELFSYCFPTIFEGFIALGVAFIGWRQGQDKRYNQERQAVLDRREELRVEGELIQLEMLQAAIKLSKVSARAIKGSNLNGDVDKALNWAEEVEDRQGGYLRKLYSER